MFRSVFNTARKPMAAALMGAATFGAYSYTSCEEAKLFATSFSKKEFRPFRVNFVESLTHDTKVVILNTPDQETTDVSSFLLLKVPGCGNISQTVLKNSTFLLCLSKAIQGV